MLRKSSLAILLTCFIGGVTGISIGAVPGDVNLGAVEQGETVEQEIYIRVSNVNENFTINPYASGIGTATLFDSNYENMDRLSENSGSEYWEFQTATVDPDTTISENEVNVDLDSLPDLQGVTTGTLTVPQDAEPGIRRGYIYLGPDLSGSGSGAGATVIAPTRISYSFDVPGEVRRDVVVQDVRGFRTDENSASVELLLSNRGTVTVTSEEFEFNILNSRRGEETTLRAPGVTLEPGESEWTNAYWLGGDVEEGTYQVDGQIDYFTGMATASGSFSLGDIVEVVPSDSPASDQEQNQQSGLPLWLVFMVLAILTVLMWSFDIEPFWILAIIGGLAVASFILLSGVSNYLLVVLLMAVGIVVYGVM